MKPLSQHIQETLSSQSLKEIFIEKLIDEELNALNRVAPAEKISKVDTNSLVDSSISGK